jgi:hypothetical protein
MQYFVKRGEQRFGPYSLSDLQRYVQSGNIMSDDVAQSEAMTDWVPVSQILGNIPSLAADGVAAAAATPEPRLVALPPNLHWAIVLILVVVTRQLFNFVWALVQANWAKNLSDDNKPLVLVAMYPAGMVAGVLTMLVAKQAAWLGALFLFAGAIMLVVGVFSIKHAMEEYYNSTENIGLALSGVMTFFFGTTYLQYHINRLAKWKKTGVLS